MAPPSKSSAERNRELKVLRGVAIFVVTFFHDKPGRPGFTLGTLGAYMRALFARKEGFMQRSAGLLAGHKVYESAKRIMKRIVR